MRSFFTFTSELKEEWRKARKNSKDKETQTYKCVAQPKKKRK